MVNGDATRLVQVIGNLLQNAVKFTESGGHIRLSVERDGDEALIRVQDTGIGITAEMLPKVFELFAQSDPSQSGLGIGLALVRRLAEMHDGTVSAQSEGVGSGTTIEVRLPLLVAGVGVPGPARARVLPSLESRRILVADDNEDAAAALAMHLELLGHEVRVVHDGLEALEVAAAFQPQIVLLDLGMPRMDGFGAAREMRRQPWGQQAKLVALTGWGQPQDRRETAKAGFDAHLVKPVDEFDLRRALAVGKPASHGKHGAGQSDPERSAS